MATTKGITNWGEAGPVCRLRLSVVSAKPQAAKEDPMLELTANNALDYLRAQGWIGAGQARVDPLGWGVSNIVLRVVTPQRTFVLKQSRPHLRTPDNWFRDIGRSYRAQEVLQPL